MLLFSKSFVDAPSYNKAKDWVVAKVLQQSFQIFGPILEKILIYLPKGNKELNYP